MEFFRRQFNLAPLNGHLMPIEVHLHIADPVVHGGTARRVTPSQNGTNSRDKFTGTLAAHDQIDPAIVVLHAFVFTASRHGVIYGNDGNRRQGPKIAQIRGGPGLTVDDNQGRHRRFRLGKRSGLGRHDSAAVSVTLQSFLQQLRERIRSNEDEDRFRNVGWARHGCMHRVVTLLTRS